MMQYRLVAAGTRGWSKRGGNWLWGRRGIAEESSPSQGSGDTAGYAPMPTGLAADPAMHSSEPPQSSEGSEGIDPPLRWHLDEPDPLVPPKPPTSSSPRIEHTGVGNPSKPNTHPRRPFSKNPAQPPLEAIKDVNCAGLDGSPWPDDAEGQKGQKRAQEKDNKEYFEDHKASPLSELEFADSRKPISQATDSGPSASTGGAIVFTEEQQDSAEAALMRAAEIWMWNKMRGDPDSPHGRVLRELRGEFW